MKFSKDLLIRYVTPLKCLFYEPLIYRYRGVLFQIYELHDNVTPQIKQALLNLDLLYIN